MNYDSLIQHAQSYAAANPIDGLLRILQDWKNNDANVTILAAKIDEYLADMKYALDESIYQDLFVKWDAFKRNAIDGIGGFTVNERLYCFGLFERYENAANPDAKDVIYAKLLAKR